ncbi:MAG: SafA/ExsA family spore coat assembly protein [Acidobacteriota bacterium]
MIEDRYTMRFVRGSTGSRCSGQLYTVQQGDTLYLIAQRYGVPLNILIAANPQITNPDMIMPGQIICIPGLYPPVCNGQPYTVRAGDTMYLIAQRYGIPLNVLIFANPQITNPDMIMPGQIICIPASFPATCAGQLYSVRQGDTLFLIAQRYGVSLDMLIAANPQIVNPDIIQPGQIICIPVTARAKNRY